MQRLLIVDDDASVRLTLSIALRRQGFHVRAVASGYEALAALHREPFDWLLCDMRMPHLSGAELAERAQCCAPDTRIVLMSAFASDEDADYLGVEAFLEKPLDLERLLTLLSRPREVKINRGTAEPRLLGAAV